MNRTEVFPHSVKQGSQDNMELRNLSCSMHPEIKSDKSGKCPRCEMELLKKD